MTSTYARDTDGREVPGSAGGLATIVRVVGAGALVPMVEQAVAELAPASSGSCVVPRIPDRGSLAELTDARLADEVGDALDEALAAVQSELTHLHGGRLVFVLPAGPLMAASGSAAASAVTNGVLSLARTLAIELARDTVAVNVVAVDSERPTQASLTGQLSGLLGPGGEHITGQEIYLTAGSDLGRLRP